MPVRITTPQRTIAKKILSSDAGLIPYPIKQRIPPPQRRRAKKLVNSLRSIKYQGVAIFSVRAFSPSC